MKVYCTACGALVPPNNVDTQNHTAQCARCGNRFRFGAAVANAVSEHPTFAVPEWSRQYEVTESSQELTISWRWMNITYWGAFVGAVSCLAFGLASVAVGLIPVAVYLWGNPSSEAFSASQNSLGWGLLMLGIGMYFAFIWYSGVKNRTTLHIGNGTIKRVHGPVKRFNDISIDTNAIRSIQIKEVENKDSEGPNWLSYDLYVVLHDGREERLIQRSRTRDQIQYFEQLIARYLRIGTLSMQRVKAS